MPSVVVKGIQIEYRTFGNSSSRPLLLIIGLGAQMIYWDADLCKDLAARGNYVIIFDNRDVGLSTKFGETGMPNIPEIFGKLLQGEKINPPYTLDDMADDAVALRASASRCSSTTSARRGRKPTSRSPASS